MHTKIIIYIMLINIWCGLNGFPADYFRLLLTITAPLIILLMAIWCDVLPKRIYFSYSIIIYYIWLFKEIVLSAIHVTNIAWQRKIKLDPVCQIVYTQQTSTLGIVLYANSITLTPGTITVQINNNHFIVHALHSYNINDLQEGIMDYKIKELMT